MMNGLRTDLVHGLEDSDSLEARAMAALLPAMHYLHDAICCQSHAHTLENPRYELVRGMRQIVVVGRFTGDVAQPLEAAEPILENLATGWFEHTDFGLVPELRFHNPGVSNLEICTYFLTAPLSCASMEDLEVARMEHS